MGTIIYYVVNFPVQWWNTWDRQLTRRKYFFYHENSEVSSHDPLASFSSEAVVSLWGALEWRKLLRSWQPGSKMRDRKVLECMSVAPLRAGSRNLAFFQETPLLKVLLSTRSTTAEAMPLTRAQSLDFHMWHQKLWLLMLHFTFHRSKDSISNASFQIGQYTSRL